MKNTKLDSYVEDFIKSSFSLTSLFNRVKVKAAIKGYNYLKDYFGFDISVYNSSTFRQICDYFNSICGVDIIPETTTNTFQLFPAVNIEKVFFVDKHTIVYINWDHKGINKKFPGYLYIFGRHCLKYYKYISDNILDTSNGNKETLIFTIYGSANSSDWEGIRKEIPARPFDTLYFDDNIEFKIKAHIDKWLKNKETYRSRGITFKTGILLYGSPGTGKSSLAAAIADYLDCNIIMIDSATFKDLNLNEVTASINADDKMYVVLLDDIDVILTNRENKSTTIEDKANISKLLGFLDSSNSPDNVIFVGTTNHIELFDSAISRAGRFDKIIKVGNIHKSKGTPMMMCKGFGLSDEDTKKVLASYPDDSINPADLQVKILDTIKSNMMDG